MDTPMDRSAHTLGTALDLLRQRAPLTHCLTNIVVANYTANVLLAAGAAPAMVDNPHEADLFAGIADGVLVNLGTPYDDTTAGMAAAARAARSAGTPWVLDPVAVGGLPWRTGLARELVADRPAIVRGNASEIIGLAGGAGGRGVDSVDGPEAALDAARELAGKHGCVVAVSGPLDLITDGEQVVRVANGHELMTKVTGVGCALGALMAAYAGVVDDPMTAAVAATAHLTVAADVAAQRAGGPGSFAIALLDELAAMESAALVTRVRLS